MNLPPNTMLNDNEMQAVLSDAGRFIGWQKSGTGSGDVMVAAASAAMLALL